jgi:hypothetical protein
LENTVPLFTYLCDVSNEFMELIPAKVQLFPYQNDLDAWRQAYHDQGSPEPHLSYNGRRHATAVTLLYTETPEFVRGQMPELDTSPSAAAKRLHDYIVRLAYNSNHAMNGTEWADNRLLHKLTLEVGELFMSEHMHALAREMLNSPPFLARRDGEYVYAYARDVPKEFKITDASQPVSQVDDGVTKAKEFPDQTMKMVFVPNLFMETVPRLRASCPVG